MSQSCEPSRILEVLALFVFLAIEFFLVFYDLALLLGPWASCLHIRSFRGRIVAGICTSLWLRWSRPHARSSSLGRWSCCITLMRWLKRMLDTKRLSLALSSHPEFPRLLCVNGRRSYQHLIHLLVLFWFDFLVWASMCSRVLQLIGSG